MNLFETTYNQLYQNITTAFDTKKRQNISDTVNVSNITYTPLENNSIIVKADAYSQGGTTYKPTIQFFNVENSEESTDTVSFKGNDNQEHTIKKIGLRDHDVKVGCNCMDFIHRFAMWNYNDGSLYGEKPDLYIKTTNRPPVNPLKVPGVCKHIVKLTDRLKQIGFCK